MADRDRQADIRSLHQWPIVTAVTSTRSVLVTGGAGFIGRHVVAALARDGYLVRVLDKAAGPHIVADIRDGDAVARAVVGCDAVIHLAAVASVVEADANPALAHSVNVVGTDTVVREAARAGARRVILASSSAVYGGRSVYAETKRVAEQVVQSADTLDAVVLRYFNVFGEGQSAGVSDGPLIPRLIRSALARQPAVIHGDGYQRRDFIYVADVVAATVLATRSDYVGALDIGSGETRSVRDVAGVVDRLCGVEIPPVFTRSRSGDVEYSRADIAVARIALGYAVEVPFEEGVKRTIAWSQR